MTKWIRWSGLVGFAVTVVLLAAIFLFAVGPLMKLAIETFGSDAVGAKVEVESIDLGFNPLSLNITGVQVADKDKPMENIVSFDRATANIEALPLFLGKAIIPDIQLQGVAMGTARKTSGALDTADDEKENAGKAQTNDAQVEASSQEKTSKEESQASGSSSKALPSADEILARESLLTETRGKAFQASYEEHKATIDNALADLPNDGAIKNYEAKLNSILKGKFKSLDDFKNRKKALDELKAQFKQDKAAIKAAKAAIKKGKSDLQGQWAGLKSAPKEDLNNLKGKYTLDGAGASNLAALLFGDEAGGYAESALGYYEKVRPLIVDEEAKAEKAEAKAKRLEGKFVHFESDRPMPDFWIKSMSFTMALPEVAGSALGNIAVDVKDISYQQDVVGEPIRLWAKGENLNNIKRLNINGTLDHRASANNGKGVDRFDLAIDDWQLENLDLGLAGLKLVSSQTDVTGKLEFSDGQMDANGYGVFSSSQFSSKDRTVFAKEMVAALKNVSKFDVTASAKGELSKPDVSIKSNLDSQLKKAFDKRIGEKQAELEKQLKQKLNDKLLSYAGDYHQQLKDLNLADGKLSDKGKVLEKLGKSELSDYQAQLKAEAKAKADAKKAAARAKAKADADKKKKELERKAKEKLKKLF